MSKKSTAEIAWQTRITQLLESIGLPAPQDGEPGNEACAKLVSGLEKLIAVAKAAKDYKIKQDEHGCTGQQVEGHFEAWARLTGMLNALGAK